MIVVAVLAERDRIAVTTKVEIESAGIDDMMMIGTGTGTAITEATGTTHGIEITDGDDLSRVTPTSGDLLWTGATTSAETTSAEVVSAVIVGPTAPTHQMSAGEILNVAETEKTTTAGIELRPLIRTCKAFLLKCVINLHTNTHNHHRFKSMRLSNLHST